MMRPVLLFQHSKHEGPAALGEWLDRQGVTWQLCRLDAGEPVPADIGRFSAVCALGGVMSVNDPLPFLAAEQRCIEEVLKRDIPWLGICLGGQMLARTLGARVAPMASPEIGWHPLRAVQPGVAGLLPAWLVARLPPVFQWHGEAFELPSGATPVFAGDHCPQQGFIHGRALGLQFHPEVDASGLALWARLDAAELRRLEGAPAVQSSSEFLAAVEARLTAMRVLSEALYAHWLGLRQG